MGGGRTLDCQQVLRFIVWPLTAFRSLWAARAWRKAALPGCSCISRIIVSWLYVRRDLNTGRDTSWHTHTHKSIQITHKRQARGPPTCAPNLLFIGSIKIWFNALQVAEMPEIYAARRRKSINSGGNKSFRFIGFYCIGGLSGSNGLYGRMAWWNTCFGIFPIDIANTRENNAQPPHLLNSFGRRTLAFCNRLHCSLPTRMCVCVCVSVRVCICVSPGILINHILLACPSLFWSKNAYLFHELSSYRLNGFLPPTTPCWLISLGFLADCVSPTGLFNWPQAKRGPLSSQPLTWPGLKRLTPPKLPNDYVPSCFSPAYMVLGGCGKVALVIDTKLYCAHIYNRIFWCRIICYSDSRTATGKQALNTFFL